MLVQRGTLKVGDIVVAGAEWGRARADRRSGRSVTTAGPSVPVEVLGFNGRAEAGDPCSRSSRTRARAREITEYRERQKRDKLAAPAAPARLARADMMSQLKTAGRKEFPLVIKGDVQGSVEAIIATLEKLGTDEVARRASCMRASAASPIRHDAGGSLPARSSSASTSRANKEAARGAGARNGIEIRYYNIIYDLVDDIKRRCRACSPDAARNHARQRAILGVQHLEGRQVAGCRVTDGTVERGAMSASSATTSSCTRASSRRSSASRTRSRKCWPARNAAWPSRTTRTCAQGDVIECYRVEEVKRSL